MAILRRDNGIGFDPAYAEKTFRIFKRLHSSTEYPGTGIGLSSARKIVAQMGGRIWAESHVGAGAAYHFTIPKAAVPISPAPAPQSAPH